MFKYPLITLCGSYNFSKAWSLICIESWKKIKNIDPDKLFVIPDNHLSDEDAEKLGTLGFKVVSALNCISVEKFLEKYPNLKKMRLLDITWRKLLDAAILFESYERIMLIDTDVFIKDQVMLPDGDFDVAYMREDIPAYRADWRIVWRHAMVPALNAGLIILKPEIVDFCFLESITQNYLINCKDHWWTEQSAWACLAGRSEKRLLFSGEQVRVLGGFKKRTADEVFSNQFKFKGSNEIITDFKEFRLLIENASILHFAGLGKKFFKESVDHLNQTPDKTDVNIIATPEKTLTLLEKIIISLRLYLKER